MELEEKEEELTEVILEMRDLKAARDSDDEGYYQFEDEGRRCQKSGSINAKIFFADSVRSHINTSKDDSKDGQTGADEKWFEDGEATSEEAEAAIKIKWSQSSTHVKVVETDDDYSVVVNK